MTTLLSSGISLTPTPVRAAEWQFISSSTWTYYGYWPETEFYLMGKLAWTQYWKYENNEDKWKIFCDVYSESELTHQSFSTGSTWQYFPSSYNEEIGEITDVEIYAYSGDGDVYDVPYGGEGRFPYRWFNQWLKWRFTVYTDSDADPWDKLDWLFRFTTTMGGDPHTLLNKWRYITLEKPGGGGCPHVAPWTGTSYIPENNLLMRSESNPQGGTDFDDYYQFNEPLLPKDDRYSFEIQEFEHAHSFFDQFDLIVADHHPSTSVAVDPYGNILTYRSPVAPYMATTGTGEDITSLVSEQEDGKYFIGNQDDSLVLHFSEFHGPFAKLLLYADDQKQSIQVQLKDQGGSWTTVEEIHPRSLNLHMEIVDLSPHISPNIHIPLEVRLLWTAHHILDYVGLDTSPPAPTWVTSIAILEAIGADGTSIVDLVISDDSRRAELSPGQQILLEFGTPALRQNCVRDFILYVNGYYIMA